jgi:hypothetical protein
MDLLYIGIILLLFAATFLFIYGCERLRDKP